MPDVLISEYLQGSAVDALSESFDVLYLPELWKDREQLRLRVRDVRALIVRNQTQVDAALLDAATRLVVVGRAGVGLDNIDLPHATKAGVLVTSTPDQNAISVAELALGLMLSLARSIPDADRDTKDGNWSRQKFVGTELYGKTLGIVGIGKIGYLTARRAQAFGMTIVAYDPFVSADSVLLSELKAELLELDDLLETADIVSCHLPANRQTAGLLDLGRLRKMKPTSLLINTSRGEIVNEADLLTALKAGMIAGAGLDVRSTEPPAVGELESMRNVIVTPHVAALTQEAQARVTKAICEDVARVLRGKTAQNPVNSVPPHASAAGAPSAAVADGTWPAG